VQSPSTLDTPSVDLTKPLVPQVAAMGDQYDAWVHRSVKPEGSLRLFRSDFMESMSHMTWRQILAIWVPISLGLLAASVAWAGLSVGSALLAAVGGVFLWTLIEYGLHRFVFHWKPRSSFGRRIHFLAHGIHHLDPWDPTRLVFPPVPGLLMGGLIFLGLWAAMPLAFALAAMSGVVAGYLAYDMTHFFSHHAKPRSRWGKYVKAYHLAHHHKHWTRMFGVSQPLWDIVFRTGKPRA
jgi:dihydroceramide fatty acyl 2-hydroxylase